MEWNAARILWDQQLLVLLLVVPPIFLLAGLLTFLGPRLAKKKNAK